MISTYMLFVDCYDLRNLSEIPFPLLYIDISLTCFNPNDNSFFKNIVKIMLERSGNRYFSQKNSGNIGFFRGQICGQIHDQ